MRMIRPQLAAAALSVMGSALVITLPMLSPTIAQAQQTTSASASGEVRRVDAASGKITLKHSAIPALGLSAMSLVYRIDPALLAKVKPGQQVRFTATRQGADYVVTAIE